MSKKPFEKVVLQLKRYANLLKNNLDINLLITKNNAINILQIRELKTNSDISKILGHPKII